MPAQSAVLALPAWHGGGSLGTLSRKRNHKTVGGQDERKLEPKKIKKDGKRRLQRFLMGYTGFKGNAGFNTFLNHNTFSITHTPLLELEISGWKHEYFRAKGKDGILIRFFLLGSAGGDLFSFTATRRNRVLRVQGLARF